MFCSLPFSKSTVLADSLLFSKSTFGGSCLPFFQRLALFQGLGEIVDLTSQKIPPPSPPPTLAPASQTFWEACCSQSCWKLRSLQPLFSLFQDLLELVLLLLQALHSLRTVLLPALLFQEVVPVPALLSALLWSDLTHLYLLRKGFHTHSPSSHHSSSPFPKGLPFSPFSKGLPFSPFSKGLPFSGLTFWPLGWDPHTPFSKGSLFPKASSWLASFQRQAFFQKALWLNYSWLYFLYNPKYMY